MSNKSINLSLEGRVCSKCKNFKLWIGFHKSKREPSGYKSSCKDCRNKTKKVYEKNKKEQKPKKIDSMMNPHSRKCKTCEVTKTLSEYGKSNRHKLNRKYECKDCFNSRNRKRFENNSFLKKERNDRKKKYMSKPENRQKVLNSQKKKRLDNIEYYKIKEKLYRENNKESIREAQKKYAEKNPHMTKKRKLLRSKKEKNALVSWRDVKKIKEVYKKARTMDKVSTEKYHVDHIIPLNHPDVCGLHVSVNLQILTRSQNCAKINKFDGTYENESWREEVFCG